MPATGRAVSIACGQVVVVARGPADEGGVVAEPDRVVGAVDLELDDAAAVGIHERGEAGVDGGCPVRRCGRAEVAACPDLGGERADERAVGGDARVDRALTDMVGDDEDEGRRGQSDEGEADAEDDREQARSTSGQARPDGIRGGAHPLWSGHDRIDNLPA